MALTRDRLTRNEDVIATYASSRIGNNGRGDSVFPVFDDEAMFSPFRWRGVGMVPMPSPVRPFVATPRRSIPLRPVGRENVSPAVRGSVNRGFRRAGSVLPSWYPRKPLAEITHVVKAIERRRARLGETEGLQLESPILQDRTPRRPSIFALDAHPEHDISMMTPHHSTIQAKRCPSTIGKVPKILLDIANKDEGDSDFVTPQKKLLNNIDEVEKVVMEELRKIKRTPLARRAEREKRLRTLKSMR